MSDLNISKADGEGEGGVQSMKDELHRLKVMKSYLDIDHHPHLERMVQLATRMFDVSTAVISLVDLGKQYFLARYDKSRPLTALPICTHLVQSPTLNTLQFKNVAEHPEYSGRTDVGFYAAAALISPEGYKVGT
jgi:hypothetical protein